jgi:hypothetical protein
MKKILLTGLVTGVLLFLFSYGVLYLAIKFFPGFFVAYNNPLFNSDGSRDLIFYSHPFVISLALSWFWDRFKSLFHGSFFIRGLEFGLVYALVSVLPVMWITFSALDVTVAMVASWFFYGLLQATIAGIVFSLLNP